MDPLLPRESHLSHLKVLPSNEEKRAISVTGQKISFFSLSLVATTFKAIESLPESKEEVLSLAESDGKLR